MYLTTPSASQGTPVTSNSKLLNGRVHSLTHSFTHSLTYLLTYLLISLLTYLSTPWNKVLLEKSTGFQLVKKFPALYGTRRFITAFRSAGHLSLF